MSRRVAIVAGAILLGALGAVWLVGTMLSAPVPQQIGDAPPDLRARNVTFQSKSGTTVHGWLVSASKSKGVVLLLPGVRANRLSMVGRARFLHAAGYSVLLIDLQATGESTGQNITFGWLERLDVLAAVEFIRKTVPGEPIAIIGSSLGGAAALLASPSLKIDAAILEAVYPTIERATENRLEIRFGRLGRLAAPVLHGQFRARLGVSAVRLSPVAHIAWLQCPVLIIGGTDDRHTTRADTYLMYASAPNPKNLWLIDGVGHVDFHRARREEYERNVLAFLQRSIAHHRVNPR